MGSCIRRCPFHVRVCEIGPEGTTLKPEMAKHNRGVKTVMPNNRLERDAAKSAAPLKRSVRRQSHKEKTARQAQRQGVDSSLRCRQSSQSEEGTHEPDVDP